MTSTRNPSTPRSNQKRSAPNIASFKAGIPPIDVGLPWKETVEIPLAGSLVVGPGRPGCDPK